MISALKNRLCLSALTAIAVASCSAGPVYAGTAGTFTKQQDLKAESSALNRPIRQKWGVVFGTSKYRDRRLNSDSSMEKAAREFYDYLLDPKGGNFRPDHVRLLTNEDAMHHNIEASFGPKWLGTLAGPDDLVVVFFAANGFPTTDGNSFLCTYDCSLDRLKETCVSIQSLMQTLRQNLKSDRIVLVIESCASGAADLNAGAKSLLTIQNLDLDRLLLGKGYIVISSSKPDQMTWGRVFSRNFIGALKEQQGAVSIQAAFAKAQHATEVDTCAPGSGMQKQTPVWKSDWQGKDLVLSAPSLDQTTGIPESALVFLGAESHYLRANKAAIAGDTTQAVAEYQAAIAADPNYTDALSDYGALLATKGKYTEAEIPLHHAVSRSPDDALYLANYALVLNKLGRSAEAVTYLARALQQNPEDSALIAALIDTNMASGNFARAMRVLDQAIALHPGNAGFHDRMSMLLSAQGRTEEATEQALEAVKLNPHLDSARLNLGSLMFLQGKPQAAAEQYKSVIGSTPGNADAHFLLSAVYEQQQDMSGAISEIEKFIQLANPDDQRLSQARAKLSAWRSKA